MIDYVIRSVRVSCVLAGCLFFVTGAEAANTPGQDINPSPVKGVKDLFPWGNMRKVAFQALRYGKFNTQGGTREYGRFGRAYQPPEGFAVVRWPSRTNRRIVIRGKYGETVMRGTYEIPDTMVPASDRARLEDVGLRKSVFFRGNVLTDRKLVPVMVKFDPEKRNKWGHEEAFTVTKVEIGKDPLDSITWGAFFSTLRQKWTKQADPKAFYFLGEASYRKAPEGHAGVVETNDYLGSTSKKRLEGNERISIVNPTEAAVQLEHLLNPGGF